MRYRPKEHLIRLRRVGRHRKPPNRAWRDHARGHRLSTSWSSWAGKAEGLRRWLAGPAAVTVLRAAEDVSRKSRCLAARAHEAVGRRSRQAIARGDFVGKVKQVRHVARAALWRLAGLVRGIPWRSSVEHFSAISVRAAKSSGIALGGLVRIASRLAEGFALLAWAAARRVPWWSGAQVVRAVLLRATGSAWTALRAWPTKLDQAMAIAALRLRRARTGIAGRSSRAGDFSPVREQEASHALPAWLTQPGILPAQSDRDTQAAPPIPKRARNVARERKWRAVMLSLITLFGTAGSGMLLAAFTMEPPRPPQPAEAAHGSALIPPQPQEPVPDAEGQPSLPRSVPTTVEIPSIGVFAKLLSLGVDADNELAVPPLDKADLASWYNLGPSPGELGSAVIVGHVDSEKIGPAVFFNLGRLEAGDLIKVAREDGTVVKFNVDAVMSFPKSEFPSNYIYGGQDRATLRVITCGGEYDKKNKNYLSNIVVFATYTP